MFKPADLELVWKQGGGGGRGNPKTKQMKQWWNASPISFEADLEICTFYLLR